MPHATYHVAFQRNEIETSLPIPPILLTKKARIAPGLTQQPIKQIDRHHFH
jgi:hypothetical protein